MDKFNGVQEQDSFYYADISLRILLTIYSQSAILKEYSFHDKAASLTLLEEDAFKNASSTIESSNDELAKKIIAEWGEGSQCVKTICSEIF